MELTQHQGRVGSVLQEGNQLISDGSLNSDAQGEVGTQSFVKTLKLDS